ncbi:hypothetical protein B0H15DRAFT_808311 [Mycena belliarum]|uniref:F-box domain-containing protein n=1 Tax=Mycena belliarum TaxID=1033014 RepID=A0AAD6XWH6_9AGAR|nr:hypothetical protein B0H15DRAFT_808311 [Mycena belliae]
MLDVPPEIWLYISSFISNDDLLELIGVNIQFYNLALDIRYRTIRIDTVNASTDKLLQRLRDPAAASRVRRLVVRPVVKNPLPSEATSTAPSLWQRISSVAAGRKQQLPSVERAIDALILVFPGLVNLTRFEIESWEMSPEYDLQPFFRQAWSSFGRQLEAISMAGRPEVFRQFVASDPQPVSCTTLSLQFTHELDTTAAAAVEGIMVDSVAPFINSLAPHLQSLSIWSWSTLDLSALFLNLRIFPQLRDFHLRASFNKAFPNPSGLTKLLEDNATSLQSVALRLNPAGSAMDPTSERSLGEWFASHETHSAVLANLKYLGMYPTTTGRGFDALVMYAQRSADTLTSLAVKDRYLDLDEVEALIAPVAHRHPDDGLQSLRINVRVWSAELFELLAAKLPGLQSLALYVGGSHPHRAATELFFTGMHTHSFESWKLRDIGVWQGGSEVPSGTMRLLANCIPSVRSFWGNGHTYGECKIYPP